MSLRSSGIRLFEKENKVKSKAKMIEIQSSCWRRIKFSQSQIQHVLDNSLFFDNFKKTQLIKLIRTKKLFNLYFMFGIQCYLLRGQTNKRLDQLPCQETAKRYIWIIFRHKIVCLPETKWEQIWKKQPGKKMTHDLSTVLLPDFLLA